MATTAGYLARRAAQKERVRLLYRSALKDTLNWAVHRHLFYQDASDLRDKFETNRHVVTPPFPLLRLSPFVALTNELIICVL
ncbi:hypothetical protein GUJ93_ZPchr0006g44967 [Zizania palustris]|uniref:NADH dehydrogenase [ubiquinone] 1 beta subcomplex subunit 9 n=1 Tax=Zizania palustris TaxID=103762 RepID=A0A8J5T0D9_ZIZPA|nr:hypothetical protein GUJ93_ZPchr0006g44967 [Zizania palustris]KAG8074632.1 hypothetical protein GUJ93_ZPchr0006g44967 [Zizania palustris]